MRLKHLILWDLRFQFKYGFYLLYTIFTSIYLIVLFALPSDWRKQVASVMIFSDPSALGLFFMGAIVLLEKSQRIPCAFAVSPVKAAEYICSKIISLGVISTIVAAILASFAKANNLGLVLMGTVPASILFTLLGIIIATKISSLNQFILFTAPVEVIGFVPALSTLFVGGSKLLRYYPTNVCMNLITGKKPSIIGIMITIVSILLFFVIAQRCVQKMWMSMGGVKL